MEQEAGRNDATRYELEARFLTLLPQIEETIAVVARRNRLTVTERDDFASEVKLAFIEQHYRVLEQFEGRSSLRTYLFTVVNRLLLDHRRRLWGKWHSSAAAVRLGPLAERLELLIYRDGYSADEACEIVKTRDSVDENANALRELAISLPFRTKVHMEPLSAVPSAESQTAKVPTAPDPHADLEGREMAKRCQEAIARALQDVPPDDRILLRLRFENGVSVADIARGLNLDQKKLYRRIDQLLDRLRQAFTSAGIGWDDVQGMVERGQCDLRLPKSFRGESTEAKPERPSAIEASS